MREGFALYTCLYIQINYGIYMHNLNLGEAIIQNGPLITFCLTHLVKDWSIICLLKMMFVPRNYKHSGAYMKINTTLLGFLNKQS